MVDEPSAASYKTFRRSGRRLARVPANAPLWDWTPFLDTQDSTRRAKVLDSIRSIDQRQAQAEAMLDRGDFPIGHLGSFDLDPTPALCEKARSLLRRPVETAYAQNSRSQTVFRLAALHQSVQYFTKAFNLRW